MSDVLTQANPSESTNVLVFLTCLIDGILLTSISVYYIVCLADVVFDFVPIKTGCEKMNRFVFPEVILTCYIPLVLYLSSHWKLLALSFPLALHIVYRYFTLPEGGDKYDPVSIKCQDKLKAFHREAFWKLGLNLIVSLVSIYFFVVSLLL